MFALQQPSCVDLLFVFRAVTEVSPVQQRNWAMIYGADHWLHESQNIAAIFLPIRSVVFRNNYTHIPVNTGTKRTLFPREGPLKPVRLHEYGAPR